MHLIYKINFPTNKVYIGQTINLKDRISDHLREARIGNDSKVYRAIRKYNISKDNFEIIETDIMTKELADEREIYWISYYNSYNNGYNSTLGGDVGNGGMCGSENPNSILSEEEVLDIRTKRAEMKYSKQEIYQLYQHKISKSGFHKIWNYTTFKEIGKELNSEEVIQFYKKKRPSGTSNKKCMFTIEDIIDIRNSYFIDVISSKDIAELYQCHVSTISRIIGNKAYQEIPMPKPSLAFRRKNHIFNKEEIDLLIQDFVQSKLNIKEYLLKIKTDENNVFGGYVYSSFREFLLKELKNRNIEYKK